MRCQVVRHTTHPIDVNLYMLLQHPSLWLSSTSRWNQNLPCSPHVPTSDFLSLPSDFSPTLSPHSLLPLVLQECSALITDLLYTQANRAGDALSTPTAIFPASLRCLPGWHTEVCTCVTWSLFFYCLVSPFIHVQVLPMVAARFCGQICKRREAALTRNCCEMMQTLSKTLSRRRRHSRVSECVINKFIRRRKKRKTQRNSKLQENWSKTWSGV